MAKTLQDFKGYQPKSKDEKRFYDKHIVIKHPDRNGNKDDIFNASNIKMVNRETEHGYNPGSDEKVYEDYLDEGIIIKSLGFEKVGVFNGGKKIKVFNGPNAAVEAKFYLDKRRQKNMAEESLDEISKNTAMRYLKKSHDKDRTAAYNKGVLQGRYINDKDMEYPYDEMSSITRMQRKREIGQKMAYKKLAKEELIDKIIDRFVPESYEPISEIDMILDNVRDLPEDYKHLVAELYFTLNETNASMLLLMTEDESLHPKIIDFILENKEV
jgi:hypothetical protein